MQHWNLGPSGVTETLENVKLLQHPDDKLHLLKV